MNPNELAIRGGEPIFSQGPPMWPVPDKDVLAALRSAYDDGSWGRYEGPHAEQLIARLSELHQTPHVLLCSSGTIAVELALRGVGVKPGDEVILAGYDFPGNFRAIEAVGARPVLVDIDPSTWCISAAAIPDAVGERTAAIIVSHLHGGLAEMRTIMRIANEKGLRVVEDSCQAAGAIVDGRPAGSWGDASALSFGGSKLLTAGRGGAVLTSDPAVLQRMKIFCERGNQAFPLSELQSAVLLPQIDKLHARHTARLDSVRRLLATLKGDSILMPVRIAEAPSSPAFYKLAWRYQAAETAGVPRATFLSALQAEGVAIDAGFRGFARRSASRCRQSGSLEFSRQAAEQTVILHHPVLLESAETIDRVALAFEKVRQGLGLE